MKATIDLPEELYRQVKAKTALEGRSIRGVTAELLAAYVRGQVSPGQPVPDPAVGEGGPAPDWFGLAREHLRPDVSRERGEIRAGIERGWAGEAAESPAPVAPPGALALPDELVVEIKVEAARRKRRLEDLVPELLRAGLRAERQSTSGLADRATTQRWIDEWLELGRTALRDGPPGPTVNEILAADRRRLDRP